MGPRRHLDGLCPRTEGETASHVIGFRQPIEHGATLLRQQLLLLYVLGAWVRECGWLVGGPVVCVTVAHSVCLQCDVGVDGRARDDDGDALDLGRVCGCVVVWCCALGLPP